VLAMLCAIALGLAAKPNPSPARSDLGLARSGYLARPSSLAQNTQKTMPATTLFN